MNNIKYPRYTSHGKRRQITARCLARLLRGEKLTHRDIDHASGSYRLAQPVFYLGKKLGWPIQRREIVADSNDPIGSDAEYMEYWLSEDAIAWAGEEGQQFANQVLGWEAERIANRVATTTRRENASPVSTDAREPITSQFAE